MIPLTTTKWLAGAVPILVILGTMVGLRWSGSKAGAAAWAVALITAPLAFGAGGELLLWSSLKGLWAVVFILYIIWGALALYNIVDVIDGFDAISQKVTELSGGHRILQLLVLGWVLPSFLQGVLGFGTAIAIAAPLLVGLGFAPLVATATALLGHAWSVTFGSLGSSYGLIVQMTGLEPEPLALYSSMFLGVVCVLTGFLVSFMYNGPDGVREGAPAVIILGATMGATLVITAVWGSPYVATLTAGTAGLLVGGLLLTRTPWYRPRPGRQEAAGPAEGARDAVGDTAAETAADSASDTGGGTAAPGSGSAAAATAPSFAVAFFPYAFLLILVLLIYLTPLEPWLSGLEVGFSFPRTETAFGFVTDPASPYAPIPVLTTPGTLIAAAYLVTYVYYRAAGIWRPGAGGRIAGRVTTQAVPTTVTMVTLGMMAIVMRDTGMVSLLAEGTARFTGAFYPVLSPVVGVLGAFMTGSNSSSNILFGAFQRSVAETLGADPYVMASAQTSGGSVGGMISPTKVAMGTGITGITGQEGAVIRRTLIYTLVFALIIGGATWYLV